MIKKLVLGTVQLGLDYGINNQSGKPTLDKAFEISCSHPVPVIMFPGIGIIKI